MGNIKEVELAAVSDEVHTRIAGHEHAQEVRDVEEVELAIIVDVGRASRCRMEHIITDLVANLSVPPDDGCQCLLIDHLDHFA